ncbi:amino acid permease [Solimonas sp. K1W22B-7]|uniref:APC family permease n=1 Tax=Solimonas sp. K1W22B-7 TaxID=2303331 RepID=UPI000E33268E|nr:amino acid permease [Solimonas sp. K1W22B-7]AXQ27836.1 amino acid permease [Solimonas sp. K1W22B-7]
MTTRLIRGLGFVDAAAIVVGSMIGTGVFLKSAVMAQQVGSGAWVLTAWVLAGVLSLAGALSYAELGAMFPRAGGEYVYLREAYGDLTAFLNGWTRFWIAGPGTIAAYAVGAATFMEGAVGLEFIGGKAGMGIAFILFFSALNCLHVSVGGRVQSLVTGVKLLLILGLTVGVLFFSPAASMGHLGEASMGQSLLPSGLGMAMLAALWAYDGWNNLPMAAGEVKQPEKNVPLSLILGVLLVMVVYCLINLGYFLALPLTEVLSANSSVNPGALPVATKAAMTFMGAAAVGAVSIAFVISALGAMNGSVLSNARVPFAMAQDGLFFRQLGYLSPSTRVPLVSVLVQAVIAAAMAAMGTFDQLTNYVVFSSWIFYALVCAGVIVLRRKRPELARPYRVLGYPWVPIVFVGVSVLLIANTLWTMPVESGIGLVLIGVGVPVFYGLRGYWKRGPREGIGLQ